MEHQTGLEMYCIVDEKNKKLRYGYTTGSCAAAAAQAAVRMLLSGEKTEEVALQTPKGILLHLLIEEIQMSREEVVCAVKKDGGDDPDVTHGIFVYARVKKSKEPGVHLDGGIGVGRVTRPGLEQPVGAAAINRVPRKMIRENVEQVCSQYGYTGGIDVVIEIPEGVEIGKKTFNPRLGIVGGISVLGTSGIVIPMSEAALVASIRLEMEMLVKNGAKYLVITPGNYGQAFSRESMDIDLTYSMKCSNYVGETLDMA
ncbi:MAG: cobalt-precorrin-5B (C(1))-methyltransferase CbiD, partial [Ruminococcus sp.]